MFLQLVEMGDRGKATIRYIGLLLVLLSSHRNWACGADYHFKIGWVA